jgi:hypothetical protein
MDEVRQKNAMKPRRSRHLEVGRGTQFVDWGRMSSPNTVVLNGYPTHEKPPPLGPYNGHMHRALRWS